MADLLMKAFASAILDGDDLGTLYGTDDVSGFVPGPMPAYSVM